MSIEDSAPAYERPELQPQERRHQLDPLYVENPLVKENNVTRNCFRIYRIQKAFSDALVNLRNGVLALPPEGEAASKLRPTRILHTILASQELLS